MTSSLGSSRTARASSSLEAAWRYRLRAADLSSDPRSTSASASIRSASWRRVSRTSGWLHRASEGSSSTFRRQSLMMPARVGCSFGRNRLMRILSALRASNSGWLSLTVTFSGAGDPPDRLRSVLLFRSGLLAACLAFFAIRTYDGGSLPPRIGDGPSLCKPKELLHGFCCHDREPSLFVVSDHVR